MMKNKRYLLAVCFFLVIVFFYGRPTVTKAEHTGLITPEISIYTCDTVIHERSRASAGKAKSPVWIPLPGEDFFFRQKLSGISHIRNARELGGYATTDGYTVKRGLLIRTAVLQDPQEVCAIHETYHLGYIIDLRRNKSHGSVIADPQLHGVTNVYAGMKGVHERKPRAYVDLLKRKESDKAMRAFFQTVIRNKGKRAILFHCSKGKDRTGIMAAILLSVLRVPDETIMWDYMLSAKWSMKCNAAAMKNALHYMKRTDGSVENYVIRKTGLTAADMDAIRNYYRE